MGILGWMPGQFWRTTLPELLAAYRGYQLREDRADLRAGLVAAAIYEQNRDSNKKQEPITAYDFFPHLRPKSQIVQDLQEELQTDDESDDSTDAFLAALKGTHVTRTTDPLSRTPSEG